MPIRTHHLPRGSCVTAEGTSTTWTADRSRAARWSIQLNSGGRALQLGWPGPNPDRLEQITQKIKVKYSALRDGPQHERETEGGSVAWQ
jgi:hypothetical protein